MLRHAAVNGNEHILALGSAHKAHMISKPALHSAALIIIGAGTFLIILVSALESVNVEFTHIASYFFKVFNKLVI